jgi:hypothetical protein
VNTQKLLTTALTLASGLVATKAIALAWKGVTGHAPPKAIDDDGEISIAEVVIFAAVSGAVAAFLRAYLTRGTAKWLSSSDIPKH